MPFSDNSGKGNVTTANGSVVVAGTASKFRGGSYYFPSTGSPYISIPDNESWYFGYGNFTIDLWVRFESNSTHKGLVGQWVDNSNFWLLQWDQAGQLNFAAVVLGSSVINVIASWTPTLNQWYHIAVVRAGDTIKIYVNGEDITTSGSSVGGVSMPDLGALLTVGLVYNVRYMHGWIDEVRITKGRALWNTNFVVPEYSSDGMDADTVLLIHGDDDIDVSRSQHVITNNSVTFNSSVVKFQDTSLAFNGSTSYLTAPDSNDWDFGLDAFTVEFWARRPSTPGGDQVILAHGGYGTSANDYGWSVVWTPTTFMFYLVFNPGAGAGGRYSPYIAFSGAENTWHHFAFVRESDYTLHMFVDGVEAAITGPSSISTDINFYSGVLTAGKTHDNGNYFSGYLDEVRVTKGVARWITDFVPPVRPYPNTPFPQVADADTKLLIHGNALTIDYSPSDHTVSNTNVVLSSSQVKFHATSLLFNGTNAYLDGGDQDDWNFGTGDFTLELWLNYSGSSKLAPLLMSNNLGSWSSGGVSLSCDPTWVPNKISFSIYDYATSGGMLNSTTSITTGLWYHIAVVRRSNAFSLYINGALEAVATHSGAVDLGIGNLRIGGNNWDGSESYYTGYMDEVRVTKGVARYTANFDPQQTYFPEAQDPSTKLLLHFEQDEIGGNKYFKDSSYLGRDVIPAGDAVLSSTQVKFGNKSAYFDGTGDYLSALVSDDFDIGSGDWTVDCWIYRGVQDTWTAICGRMSGTAGYYMQVNNTNKLRFDTNNNSSSITSTGSISLNTWTHVAFVSSGGTIKLYINGVQDGSGLLTPQIVSADFVVGWGGGISGLWQGYIDEFRFTKGVARWTSNFTPPTAPYEDYM